MHLVEVGVWGFMVNEKLTWVLQRCFRFSVVRGATRVLEGFRGSGLRAYRVQSLLSFRNARTRGIRTCAK